MSAREPRKWSWRYASFEAYSRTCLPRSASSSKRRLPSGLSAVTLMGFLQDGKLGMVISLQAFHLFGNTVRTPGVAFIRSGRDLAKDRPIEGAPDLAIEVVSPTNTPREIDRRISDYFCRRMPAG